MAETMKFGPQWLRNLSDGSATSTSSSSSSSVGQAFVPGKYKLAEHRYGREEMLALYVPNSKIPECMKSFPSIINEKPLQPMAFIPPTDEEQRLMSQSVNSTAVLRMMGRGSGPSQRGGRGGGDRGRGRGRGRGEGGFAGFHRQTSLEDEGYLRGRHGRGDAWEEGEKGRFERGASGFGARSSAFDEGPTSPRKDFSRSMSTDNWRELRNKSKDEEEEEGGDWRRAGPRDKWTARSNWRDHRDRDYDRGRYEDYVEGPYRERSYNRTKSGSWDDQESDLPEWSTAEVDDMDNLGTFDSSGAFMSMKEAKEIQEQEDRKLSGSEGTKSDRPERDGSGSECGDNESGAENDKVKLKEMEVEDYPDPETPKSGEERVKDHGGSKEGSPEPERSRNLSNQEEVNSAPNQTNNQAPNEDLSSSQNSGRASSEEEQQQKQHQQQPQPQKQHQQQRHQQQHQQQQQQQAPERQSPTVLASTNSDVVPRENKEGVINENSVKTVNNNGMNVTENIIKHPQQRPGPHTGQPLVDDDFGHLEKAAEDLVATWTAEEDAKSDNKAKVESGGVPLDHEDAKKWFYRDPQGDLQGPFKAAEMAEWFSAGYFTMNLLVKRGCDATFQPLGELIKRWGRVPFLPGPALPPLKDTGIGITPAPAQPQLDIQQEQLKILQQQMIMQQQLYLQQVQMGQMMATLQQQESFAKLSPQQQQQLALQLMLKHHVQIQQGQASQHPQQATQPPPSQQSPQQSQPPTQQQPPQSLSPRSEAQQVPFQRQMSQPVVSQAPPPGGAGDAGITGFHRSLSQQPQQHMERSMSQPQQHMEENTLWGGAKSTPTSAGWTAPTSVWDIDPPKTQSLDEIQRLECLKIDQQQREEAERREGERRRQEEEMRKRQEEEERRRQEEEMRRRQEEERRKQLEMELERQRLEQIERIRLQREAEENARREEERRRREEEERRRREEEDRRQREAEDRRRQLEEQRRKEQEELERKRQEEIRRRQEKAEEMRRQQQEALRRLQEEQMANIQLPQTAQWASSSRNSPSNSAPSLAEIQEVEAQRAAKEAEEKQRRLEQQRQQLAAIQQQQQQQNKTWAQQRQVLSTSTATTPTSNAPSLLEIQQEQAMQLEREKQRQQQQQQQKTQNLPLRTAAVWSGASNASHWAAEGAWGNLQNRQSAGFWDDAVGGASNKKIMASSNNNSTNSFPTLTTTVPPQQAVTSNKNKTSKAKREEESVQRLFQQAMKPKDEFTQWCENALRGMQSSVDVPTFVAFLMDVESPYEVHDYVRSYLGEGKDAIEFGKQFLERRSKYKNHLKQDQPEEIWGPAQAVNPNLKNEDRTASCGSNKNNKKKKRMQKVDSSILGFTVHADTERLNMGEIENSEAATLG